MVDAFKANDSIIPVRTHCIGQRAELISQLPLAHFAYLKCGLRGIDLHVLDMNVAEITITDLIIAVRIGKFVSPAVIGWVPQHLEHVLGVQFVYQTASSVV